MTSYSTDTVTPEKNPILGHAGRIMITLSFVALLAFPVVFWFDTDHFRSPEWHIHARFHILWKTMMIVTVGGIGLWLVVRRWQPSTARSIAGFIPVAVWTTHLISNMIMKAIEPANAFPHHQASLLEISIADWAILFTLAFAIVGFVLDQLNLRQSEPSNTDE